MKYLYYTFIITLITVTSCKNNDSEKDQTGSRLIVPFTQQNASTLQNQNAQTPVVPKNNLFHENNAVSNPTVASGVNPAHGQPNHNCDIPVGAPLNSRSKSSVPVKQSNLQSAPVTSVVQKTPIKTVVSKGMNPPHGESGHRCDISVGAPLNSKPVTSTVSKPVSEQPKVENNIPALLSTDIAEKPTPKGMNPPHGKEGHICGVEVGAPLPKE